MCPDARDSPSRARENARYLSERPECIDVPGIPALECSFLLLIATVLVLHLLLAASKAGSDILAHQRDPGHVTAQSRLCGISSQCRA